MMLLFAWALIGCVLMGWAAEPRVSDPSAALIAVERLPEYTRCHSHALTGTPACCGRLYCARRRRVPRPRSVEGPRIEFCLLRALLRKLARERSGRSPGGGRL